MSRGKEMVSPFPLDAQGDSPLDGSRMVVQLSVDDLRALLAESQASKKQELPRLLYNTVEAAKILDVPPTWLAAQARAGKIPVVRKGHYVRFRMADLEAFANKSDVDTPEG